jgi:ribosome-associated protein
MPETHPSLKRTGSRTDEELQSVIRRRATGPSAAELKDLVVEAILAKKGIDVVVVGLIGVSEVADYFVLCTAESDLQSKAIVDGIKHDVEEACGERPWRMEGTERRKWVLVDYVDVVVHVFDREARSFYDLERLWGDAPQETITDEGPTQSRT